MSYLIVVTIGHLVINRASVASKAGRFGELDIVGCIHDNALVGSNQGGEAERATHDCPRTCQIGKSMKLLSVKRVRERGDRSRKNTVHWSYVVMFTGWDW